MIASAIALAAAIAASATLFGHRVWLLWRLVRMGAAPIRTSLESSQTRRPNSVAETAIAAASAIALAITSLGPSAARR